MRAFSLRLCSVISLVLGLAFSLALPPGVAFTATPTPAPSASRRLDVPILLYHHISAGLGKPTERYVVSRLVFEQQMRSLKAWGYTTITLAELSAAITDGEHLPPRPLVITFDDGYQDVYLNAYPILEKLNYTATVFVIGRQLGLKSYLGKKELQELSASGWEVGNHTFNHHSLRQPGINLELEIETARDDLAKLLGIEIPYFSFPYGLTSQYVTRQVQQAGYVAAVGLGGSYTHGTKTRFYLSRIEILPGTSTLDLMELLPWAGPPGGRGSWNGLVQ